MRSSSGRWLMRQHHQGVQTMWLKPNSTRSMPLRCAQCQGPHVIHRTAPQASGCIHTCSNFPVQVIWKTMAFDLAPMIESLHRAPCAAHMLLSMVAQSIVTVSLFFLLSFFFISLCMASADNSCCTVDCLKRGRILCIRTIPRC